MFGKQKTSILRRWPNWPFPKLPPRLSQVLSYAFVIAALLSLSACGDKWGWYVVNPNLDQGYKNLDFLLGGYGYTISMSALAIVLSLVGGLILALPAFSSYRALRWLNLGLVESLRSVPPLVMILWVYYGLPIALSVNLSIFEAGVIALALADLPFMAEIYRTGIQAVPEGQREAAKAVGLKARHIMWLIVLPQAIRSILPALANQFVLIVKTSSLVSIIGYGELTRRANELVVQEYRSLEIYSILVLEYLVLVLIISLAVRWFEGWIKRAPKS